ncbi:efflux transporter outer membrane subunit [Rhodanobacter denitrificans]|uniref:Efflux transporter, outer membrane factor lipoprotein, NodT family n=1 Tax=Rhodanobacter denitrificans TaxID=666685 RepID=M4NPB8_9GAMM|nr:MULTISPECIES: efflux transporter outer membrane subunit [Rhodanobacter]AGG89481.1 efflux transporter, outer membrane factor lipoprotein, NodT family [Rhodanobacter denitrificans]UJM88361.1 efflux transporter outer membrane subunit [Rhodanobacter denitrificans]UJM88623.1 efflux transporter outer membrane subunit [Rhodanobacter denitrificans]
MKHAPLRGRTVLVAAMVLALAGCAAAPARLGTPALRDDVPLAGLQAPVRAGWPTAQWWRQYDDPQLDGLMDRAMQQSPDLALAQSRVRNAEQSAKLAAAQLGLSVNGSAQVTRERLSDHGLIPSQFLGFSWYNQADLGVQLQYDFDWWGKKRATMEAALDQAHAAEAQRSAAALAIQYAVADTYFGWQADQARLQLADRLLATQQQFADIAELRVRQGVDLPDEAQKARAQLAAVREMRVALDGSAQIRRAALASLLGVAPTELPELRARPLPAIERGVPANGGLDLIARRPDIAASRWQVEAALKQTDAARAEFFPDISLTALAGLSSIDMGKLLTAGSRTFALTPALHLPIFNGGALEANYGVSKAQLDAAVAQYDSAVLAAAREVATQALSAEQVAARRHEQQAQLDADQRLLANAQARARQGVRDLRESLGAQAALLQQRDAATQLQAQAVSTDLALIKALGGGYRATDAATSPSSSVTAGAAPHERH